MTNKYGIEVNTGWLESIRAGQRAATKPGLPIQNYKIVVELVRKLYLEDSRWSSGLKFYQRCTTS